MDPEPGEAQKHPDPDQQHCFFWLSNGKCWQVMVFFSSCMSVKFHHELLNYIDLPVMCIHGKQKQTKRTTTFFQFCNADSGILLCTDVAARGVKTPKTKCRLYYPKCRLYWCLIEFIGWLSTGFVNYCPYNLLSDYPPPPPV
jgi:superfamily II DNA/RNA helicase